jgi:hypothetical protein
LIDISDLGKNHLLFAMDEKKKNKKKINKSKVLWGARCQLTIYKYIQYYRLNNTPQ